MAYNGENYKLETRLCLWCSCCYSAYNTCYYCLGLFVNFGNQSESQESLELKCSTHVLALLPRCTNISRRQNKSWCCRSLEYCASIRWEPSGNESLDSMVRPASLYSSCWPATIKHAQALQVMEMKMLRWPMDATRLDHIENNHVRTRVEVAVITEKLSKNALCGMHTSPEVRRTP